MSSTDEKGQAEPSSNFPFQLRFQPHSDVHSLFPTDLPGSDPMIYVSQLESVPANARLYDVYALDKPQGLGGSEQLIGTLVLDGKMTRSKWGDDNLYIRHQKMDEDRDIHKEWEPYIDKFSIFEKNENGWGCPFLDQMLKK